MRFGLIGTNFITDELIAAGHTVKGFEPFAVCSRTEERGRAFAQKHGISRVCTSPEELAAMEEVEAVYIATPNSCHFAQAETMLRAGKHVLAEKPATPSEEEFKELCKLAEENGCVLLEGMRTIHTPGFRAVKEALPRLGSVRQASISYCQYSRRYDHFREGIVENAFDPRLCNSAIMDIGVYCAAALVTLFGMPRDIRSFGWELPNGFSAMGKILCDYGGMLADLSYSKVSDSRHPSEIQGEQGTILFEPPTNPARVEFISRKGEREILFEDPGADFFGMKYEIAHFIAMAEGRSEETWQEYALHTAQTLRLMDQVRRQQGIEFM